MLKVPYGKGFIRSRGRARGSNTDLVSFFRKLALRCMMLFPSIKMKRGNFNGKWYNQMV